MSPPGAPALRLPLPLLPDQGMTPAKLPSAAATPVRPSNPAAGWASLSYKIGAPAPCPVLPVK
jgi:hypothetical protein